jgi:hypothetical protein
MTRGNVVQTYLASSVGKDCAQGKGASGNFSDCCVPGATLHLHRAEALVFLYRRPDFAAQLQSSIGAQCAVFLATTMGMQHCVALQSR